MTSEFGNEIAESHRRSGSSDRCEEGLLYEPNLFAASEELLRCALEHLPGPSGQSVGSLRLSPRSVSLVAQGRRPSNPMHQGQRKPISSFSLKSRVALRKAIAEIDFTPFLERVRQGWWPVLLTLTLPSDWEELVPTAPEFWRKFASFRMRLARAIGETPLMVTKREFQRRGAPHFHVITVIPATLMRNGGVCPRIG